MKLERIDISNFKGLQNASFEPKKFACLIGENNAGKSTVLQAIVHALNRPTQLPLGLHYDAALPIVFRLAFTDITEPHLLRLAEEHRSKIADLVVDGRLNLVVRYPPNERMEVLEIRRVPRDARFSSEGITAAIGGRRGGALRDAFVTAYGDVGNHPENWSMGAAKECLEAHIKTLPDAEMETREAPLRSGIGSSITALLPEPIYIPAVKNLADDMKTTQSTSFGRLLGLLMDDMEPDLHQIHTALASLNTLFNRTGVGDEQDDHRHAKVRSLEALVESLLRENFPQVKVQLHVPPPELKTILNSAQIFIDDGSKDLVDNKGDGIKRMLTFCLLQAYVQHSSQVPQDEDDIVAERPLLFLFEEPELYLHPRSQRILFNTLARISETHQVAVSTHSPLFFVPGVTASFVRVAKRKADPKPVGELFPIAIDLNEPQAETFRLARFENADAAFFSRRVVLFEGESDDFFCAHVAKMLNEQWDFHARNIAMVRVSGKGNFAKYRAFFEAFGIEVKIVADLDTLFDGFQHLNGGAAAAALRGAAIQAIDARVIALAIRPEPNPIYAEFVDYDPSEVVQAEALANASNFYNVVGKPYDASKVVAIIDSRYANAAQQRIKGVDLSGSYRLGLGMGQLTIRGSASWLDSTQALTAAQSPYHLAGTLFNPTRINTRIGAVWQQGGFTASLFGNYKSGVTDTTDGRKGASFTTVDATLHYDTGARDDAWSNLVLELSAQNLLNRAPPFYAVTSLAYAPYDSTNYSAVGRFLSLSVPPAAPIG